MSRILVTSALPYINGVKHMGNLAGSMLPADAYSRAMRLMGHEVLYICATDEHGTPAELAAAEAGLSVSDYCDKMHIAQKEAGANFKLSYDYFGRSSSAATHKLTQEFALALEANGFIEERTSKQVYSIADGRYLPDRYVEGTCPNCGFESARGDQCDSCGKLLDPVDLINPYSAVSGSHDVEIRDTNHLYLKQSDMSGRLRDWVESHRADWPALTTSIAMKWLDEGLRVAYIGATQDWASETGGDWEVFWRTDKGAEATRYVQFMGKDNVAFHTLSFPTTIMGSGQPWKLVDELKAFNWVTWYGGKFSTSQKRNEPKTWCLYGSSHRYCAVRLLAVVSYGECAREFRRRLHMGRFSSQREFRFGQCFGFHFTKRVSSEKPWQKRVRFGQQEMNI